jgi:hypothetical protein
MKTEIGLGALILFAAGFHLANVQDAEPTPQPCPAATAGPTTLTAPTPTPAPVLKKLPGKRTPPTITLKRGMTRSAERCPAG